MNFVEQLLNNGFQRFISESEKRKGRYDSRFNPLNGWMGVVIYHPCEKFMKDDKIVELSLERFGVTDTTLIVINSETEEMSVTSVNINERLIKISVGDKIIYENKYGVMPPKEIENILYA